MFSFLHVVSRRLSLSACCFLFCRRYIAWDDCYMRNRGKADWLLFTDIDELPFSPAGQAVANPSQTLHTALQFCDTQFRDNGKVGCALTSVTVASVFMRVRSFAESHKLLLEEYSHGEAKPRCPFNCGARAPTPLPFPSPPNGPATHASAR